MPNKVWKADFESPAGMAIGNEVARMHGNKDNYVQCDGLGTYVSGRMSLLSQMQEVRTGGLWTFNTNFALMIPSTLGTPIPVLNVDPPLKMLETIGQQAAIMIGLFASLSTSAL
jgi:hypothetical protein